MHHVMTHDVEVDPHLAKVENHEPPHPSKRQLQVARGIDGARNPSDRP